MRKSVGVELIVVGVILLIVAIGADVLPFHVPGFGWKQITGTIVGMALLLGGVFVYRGASSSA